MKLNMNGWSGIIAQQCTTHEMAEIAQAIADWMHAEKMSKVVVGFDTRFGGSLFAETICRVLGSCGIRVHFCKQTVTSAMISLGIIKTKSDLGILVTAGNQGASFNGIRLKNAQGASVCSAIGQAIQHNRVTVGKTPNSISMMEMFDEGLLNYIDLETMYFEYLRDQIDLDAIQANEWNVMYDAMYGAGQRVIRRLLPTIPCLHAEKNPSFGQLIPHPGGANIQVLAGHVKSDPAVCLGFATNADASELGIVMASGEMLHPQLLMMILTQYLKTEKGVSAPVYAGQGVSNKVIEFCNQSEISNKRVEFWMKDAVRTVGDKEYMHICDARGNMVFGLHVPDHDGIYTALLLLECLSKTGKTVEEWVTEMEQSVGHFYHEQISIRMTDDQLKSVEESCRRNEISQIGADKILSITEDCGFSLTLSKEEWVLFVPNPVENKLEVVAQAGDERRLEKIMVDTRATLEDIYAFSAVS